MNESNEAAVNFKCEICGECDPEARSVLDPEVCAPCWDDLVYEDSIEEANQVAIEQCRITGKLPDFHEPEDWNASEIDNELEH